MLSLTISFWQGSRETVSNADVVDSLCYYYKKDTAPTIYQEFWNRRKGEGTDEIVYEFISNLSKLYADEKQVITSQQNDALAGLLKYEIDIQNTNDSIHRVDIIKNYGQFLTEKGLGLSAYNLLYLNDYLPTQSSMETKEKVCLEKGNKTYFLNRKSAKLVKAKPFESF